MPVGNKAFHYHGIPYRTPGQMPYISRFGADAIPAGSTRATRLGPGLRRHVARAAGERWPRLCALEA